MLSASSICDLSKNNLKRVAIAVGNFDGFHRGHRLLIDKLLEVAKKSNSIPVVVTFHPHPRAVLRGEDIPILTPEPTKLRLLEECQVRGLITLEFKREFASLSAEEFLRTNLVCQDLEITDICIGSQWRFGANREGDVEFLQKQNLIPAKIHPVEELKTTELKISSSTVRQALKDGDFEQAEQLLGRAYSLWGSIEEGFHIGSDLLQCPTANINLPTPPPPLSGVYAVEAILHSQNKERYISVCNIGYAPTFHDDCPLRLEVHLLDFKGDLSGQLIEVQFHAFIRSEKTFSGPEELKSQIQSDIAATREYFLSKTTPKNS